MKKPISATANSAARTKRIFVRGTRLEGAFQRRTTRNRAHGAAINAGQNRSIGKVEIARASESYIVRRGSTFSVLSKQRGQMWRPSTSRSQRAHRKRPHCWQGTVARLCG